MEAAIAIAIFAAVFIAIFFNLADRRTAVIAGAAAMLFFGSMTGFYSLWHALDSIYFNTLALIFGMSAIAALFIKSGMFDRAALSMVDWTEGDGWKAVVLFSLLTYVFSLVINNLSAMVMIVPITLILARRMRLNPIPILIAEIVASNLGGASTRIGDFPNMIIAGIAHLHFFEFITGMMVPCLILLAVALAFFQTRRREVEFKPAGPAPAAFDDDDEVFKGDSDLGRIGLIILGATLVLFMMEEQLGVTPGWIALGAGVAALVFGRFDEDEFSAAVGASDIAFFLGLFVMVGGLAAANVMDGILWGIDAATDGSDLARLLVLMWVAAFVTIFLNAGPSTAFFIPVAVKMYAAMDDTAVWWALSLGVLAGSSAALTGATAGAVTVSNLERFCKKHPDMRECMPEGQDLDFREFLRWGLPIMGIFLVLSSGYIAIIAD